MTQRKLNFVRGRQLRALRELAERLAAEHGDTLRTPSGDGVALDRVMSLLKLIDDHSGELGWCWASVPTLATEMGKPGEAGRRMVYRILEILDQLGLIVEQLRSVSGARNGTRRIYRRVCWPNVLSEEELPDSERGSDDESRNESCAELPELPEPEGNQSPEGGGPCASPSGGAARIAPSALSPGGASASSCGGAKIPTGGECGSSFRDDVRRLFESTGQCDLESRQGDMSHRHCDMAAGVCDMGVTPSIQGSASEPPPPPTPSVALADAEASGVAPGGLPMPPAMSWVGLHVWLSELGANWPGPAIEQAKGRSVRLAEAIERVQYWIANRRAAKWGVAALLESLRQAVPGLPADVGWPARAKRAPGKSPREVADERVAESRESARASQMEIEWGALVDRVASTPEGWELCLGLLASQGVGLDRYARKECKAGKKAWELAAVRPWLLRAASEGRLG